MTLQVIKSKCKIIVKLNTDFNIDEENPQSTLYKDIFGLFLDETCSRTLHVTTVMGLYSTSDFRVSFPGADHYSKAAKPLECEARKQNVLSASWISRAICRTWSFSFSASGDRCAQHGHTDCLKPF